MEKAGKKKGILVVISGFSGVGKGYVVRKLVMDYPGYALSVSVTTREPREGEEEGREYFFRTKEEFREMIRFNALIEWAEYVDNYYGTPRSYVEEKLAEGKNVILEIDVQGAENIKKLYPDAVTVFVTTRNYKELENRLKSRGTETPEEVKERMAQTLREAGEMNKYDYILLNQENRLEECVEHLHHIVKCEECAACRNQTFINSLQQDIKINLK